MMRTVQSFFVHCTLSVALTSLMNSCQHNGNGSGSKAVFDNDNRISWDDSLPSDSFPFHSIGLMDPSRCTGFQVSSQLVLTAAHCVWNRTSPDYRFGLGYQPYYRLNAGGLWGARVLAIGSSVYWSGKINDDWAILQTFQPTTVTEGLKVASSADMNPVGMKAWVAGFSADMVGPSFDSQCSVRAVQNGVVYHDCDTTGGSSGAPIWVKNEKGERFVVGINNSEVSGHNGEAWTMVTSNTGVSADQFISQLNDLLKKYP